MVSKDILFQSKEYGVGGHNQLDVRIMGDDVQFWLRDGDRNAVICMDKGDLTALKKALTKAIKHAPENIEPGRDYTQPTRKKKVETTTAKKTRRTKAKTKNKSKDKIGKSYEEIKAEKIAEVMNG